MRFQKILSMLLIASAAAGARAQIIETNSIPANAPIPTSGTGGAAGGASNPANVATATLTCVTPRYVDRVEVGVNLNHTAVGNLRIEVSHCGTTVVLYDQSPASTANLTGVYEFDSVGAPATFGSAVQAAPANGAVPAGTYTPSGSLGAFNGKSSWGQWTLKVFDLAASDVGTLLGFTVTIHTGQTDVSGSAPGPIPDGFAGACLSPVTHVVNVTDHGAIDELVVDINLTHTFVSDLDITVQHGGVIAVISEAGLPVSSANLSGWYTFYDGAASWTAAETQYAQSTIPGSNGYAPKEAFSVFRGQDRFGPWYVTICDRSSGDVGSVNLPAQIRTTVSPYHLEITQPNGPASITLTNSGGKQGNIYGNFFTLTPGIAPFGWLFGLDITLPNLMAQMDFGNPFVGLFDSCGNASFTIPGPIPTNLTVWYVTVETDGGWSPVALEAVRSYTTSP